MKPEILWGQYRAILADPPWSFRVWGRDVGKRSAASHYDTMPLNEIAALPVGRLAAPDCALFLWVPGPSQFEILGDLETTEGKVMSNQEAQIHFAPYVGRIYAIKYADSIESADPTRCH